MFAALTMTARADPRTHAAPAEKAPVHPPAEKAPGDYDFSLDTLLEEARRRGTKPYSPQRSSLPAGLDKLSPEQYRSIHFNPDSAIWRQEDVPFRVELLRTGFNLQSVAVTVSTVENGVAHDVVATPDMFEIGPSMPQIEAKVSLPLSGFRLKSQINSKKVWDEFLVFQGASYFRAVAQHLLYGLSARGLAVNTAEPSGEEFPAFTHFWIERPDARAKSIVIYALLESDSVTGAYRFTVQPGPETVMDVELTLFPRAEMRVVGIAPMTSMFLFDETNRGRLDDYRPEVHDSDGLMIESSSGESIFRQLAESHPVAGVDLHDPAAEGLRAGAALPGSGGFSGLRESIRAAPQRLGGTEGRVGRGGGRTGGDPVGPREQRQHRGLLASGPRLAVRTTRRISNTASRGWRSPPCPRASPR